jgi:putative NADPH-quinone reductase
MRRIVIIQGHPDRYDNHFCHAIAESYRKGADASGCDTSIIDVASLDFDFLRSRKEWEDVAPPPAISDSQLTVSSAEHLVFIFPLWLGSLPALFKAFLEQVFRPNFAFDPAKGPFGGRLKGRSARIIVTMGMPGWIYRAWYLSHGIKAFEQGILHFVGIRPTHVTIVGSIEAMSESQRKRCLAKIESLGRKAR